MNNPLTGLINFIGIFWGAFNAGTPEVAIGAVVSTLISTGMAYLTNANRDKINAGHYGFNGLLIGAGIPFFFGNGEIVWAVLVLASMVSTVVAIVVSDVLDTWKIPAFTLPFSLVTWCVILLAREFNGPVSIEMSKIYGAHVCQATGNALNASQLVVASLNSLSQIWFINSPVSGVFFLIGLFVESAWCGAAVLGGAMIAVVGACLLGVDSCEIYKGYWGYSAILTAAAIGCIFMKPCVSTVLYAVLATITTVCVQGALNIFMPVLGLPTFTVAFMFTSWLFLLANFCLRLDRRHDAT